MQHFFRPEAAIAEREGVLNNDGKLYSWPLRLARHEGSLYRLRRGLSEVMYSPGEVLQDPVDIYAVATGRGQS